MDWVKIKAQHILFSAFTDVQVSALVKAQLLTAQMERMPTRKHLVKVIHHQILKSLEAALIRDGFSLNAVLMKVLCDVDEVKKDREASKKRMQALRASRRGVTPNETRTFENREDERKEEERREEKRDNSAPSADSLNLVSKTSKNLKTATDCNEVDLRGVAVENNGQSLSDSQKNKIAQGLKPIFDVRGWKYSLIRSVFEAVAGRVKDAEIEGDLYAYFESAVKRYCNENAELLTAGSRK